MPVHGRDIDQQRRRDQAVERPHLSQEAPAGPTYQPVQPLRPVESLRLGTHAAAEFLTVEHGDKSKELSCSSAPPALRAASITVDRTMNRNIAQHRRGIRIDRAHRRPRWRSRGCARRPRTVQRSDCWLDEGLEAAARTKGLRVWNHWSGECPRPQERQSAEKHIPLGRPRARIDPPASPFFCDARPPRLYTPLHTCFAAEGPLKCSAVD